MKRYMQFRTQPRKLPVVFSVEEVSDNLTATPGPGLKYRAALSISYGGGLRAAEVCNLKTGDIGSDPSRDIAAQYPAGQWHADPCRAGQGPEGPQGHALARVAGSVARVLA
jgi:hypothetical protein